MYDHGLHQLEDMPESLDRFLEQLLGDMDTPPSLPPPSSSVAVPEPDPAAHHAHNLPLTCQWVLMAEPRVVCSATLPLDPKHACNHFREAHNIRGNEKVVINCHWRDCQAPPMQRGSLIRHVLSVHLSLLRWQCGVCGRVFSRKGTGHACSESTEG